LPARAGGADPATNELPEGIEAQAEQAFRNVETLLQEAGLSLGDVASCLVHLSDLSLFQRYNAVWERVFASEPRPVRTTVGAALLNEMLIEVTAIARRS
jgi:2-iminobutanoate/2-iminopropanoate deaminase